MLEKRFRLRPVEIRELAPGHGACYATDHITVDGHRVGYAYREAPNNLWDSGWRFFSGLESDDYVDDPANFEIYDVNTIVNYDPEILPLLDAPVGSAFARDEESGRFVEEPFRPREE
jgi:hypothetical protein